MSYEIAVRREEIAWPLRIRSIAWTYWRTPRLARVSSDLTEQPYMIKTVRRALAPTVALAAVLVSGAVMANHAQGHVTLLDFDEDTDVITGLDASAAVLALREVPGVTIRGIINPDVLPAGKCRSFGVRWNVGVILGKSESWWRRLYADAVASNCNVEVDTDDVANGDGTYDLNSIQPAP
jgi:hypothetical protein